MRSVGAGRSTSRLAARLPLVERTRPVAVQEAREGVGEELPGRPPNAPRWRGLVRRRHGPAGPLTGTSDDPGVFTMSETQTWFANTIIVRPAAAGASCSGRIALLGVGC